jgi:hypothetical protein
MSPPACVVGVVIQLSPTQADLLFKVLCGTPLSASTSLVFSSTDITCDTVGDVCAVQDALKAAKILGYSDRMLGQIQTKIDRALVALGQKNAA